MSQCHEIPPRQVPATDSGYLEILTKSIFQAGFSWEVIRQKWPDFRRAFDGFDVDTVASYGAEDVDRLLADPGIVRNGRKIEATIQNARIMQRLIAEYGSVHAYLRSLDGQSYAQRRRELTRRFHHLGPTGAFVFLYTVGEDVPHWEQRRAEDV
ncbi:MAG: DNA-3-methyladenine glycosylase I [Anaerolineae bacterium]|nr:DNA-3-methyladenine glycosylase I [Anaerolineae bacterium]